ncbi:holo-ACP synthase [Kitasatospora purpeofusca]|uniref:holo-ACP synthase n=1 Tax=Kitasatospora purpeofusca TaxID=67352 RepID=UPI0036E1F49C
MAAGPRPARGTDGIPAEGAVRVGVDIVRTDRVRDLLRDHGPGILTTMLTARELADSATAVGLDLLTASGRIAAKEAVFKLLRARDIVLPWLEVEVSRQPGGAPRATLSGRIAALAEEAGVHAIDISISHDGDYAVAMAVSSPTRTTRQDRPAPDGTESEEDTVPTPLQRLEQWILDKNPQYTEIDPDLDLIENRLVDSLAFAEFVYLLGRLTEVPVDVQNLDIEDFRTLRRVADKYLLAGVD